MNFEFRKKLPMIILFCILLGIVIYLITSNSGFGNITAYPAGDGVDKAGYAKSAQWDSTWGNLPTDFKNFFFPDPSRLATVPAFGMDGPPSARYTTSSIFVTSYSQIMNDITYPLDDYISFDSNFNSTGPTASGPKYGGEYGLFNYIIQTDQRINAYMNNDFTLIPLELYISSASGVSPVTYTARKIDIGSSFRTTLFGTSIPPTYNVGYYPVTASGFGTQTTIANIGSSSPTTELPGVSFNQAILIPSNMIAGTNGFIGTAGNNGATYTASLTNFQKLRFKIILGVLTSMHLLLNGSPATIPDGCFGAMPNSVTNYPTGAAGTALAAPTRAKGPEGWSIAYDLKFIYNPSTNSTATYKPYYWTNTVTPAGVTTKGVANPNTTTTFEAKHVPTPYVLHALYLILNARNTWINSIITTNSILSKY